jgi:ABC-2 type transport system permease protein
MREALVVAKRDFLERVRSKLFIVMTIVWPLFMIGLIVVPAVLAGRSVEGATIDIVDRSGAVAKPVAEVLESPALHWHVTIAAKDATPDQEGARIHQKAINGYLVIPDNILTGGDPVYYGDNASNQMVQVMLQQLVPTVIMKERARSVGLSDDQIKTVLGPMKVSTQHTTGTGQAMSGIEGLILGYILAFLMYMAILLYGINVMRSVVTEKSSRVVELLVAAAKPRALMAGKILGVGGAGLAQLMIWLVVGAIALSNRDALLSAFGVHASGGSVLPALTFEQIAVSLVFFIGGYIFYASLFAAVGATVSSEQDTQQAQMPVTMLLVVAIISMQAVTSDPRGSTSEVMTMVPCWSPILMPLRYFLGGATLGELGLSIGILVVSTVLITRAAAKIYRVGILMYGKRPGLRELIRWLKY